MSIKNFKLTIQYDGTCYSGWQIQKDQKTVQGLLKNCVQKIVKSENINLVGSGRTDSGVHSIGQVVNFKVTTNMGSLDFKKAMNANLPYDIRVVKSEIVDMDFNSRYSAKKREYLYMIKKSVSPFDYKYYHMIKDNIDIDILNQCAEIILKNNDFSNFCKHSPDIDNYFCSIDYSLWEVNLEESVIQYRIRANRFLHHMVRMLVGTMLSVSKGSISLEKFKNMFYEKTDRNRLVTAPSRGLYLSKVFYE